MVSVQDLSLFHTRRWKAQDQGSAGPVPFREIRRSPAQRYARTNHFQKPHFPAYRLQYAQRRRKLITGHNLKPILPDSVSARHAYASILLGRELTAGTRARWQTARLPAAFGNAEWFHRGRSICHWVLRQLLTSPALRKPPQINI